MVEFLLVLVFILICICVGMGIALKTDYKPDPTVEKIKTFLNNNSVGYDSNCTHSPSEAIDHISYLIHGKSYHANSSKFDGDNTCNY